MLDGVINFPVRLETSYENGGTVISHSAQSFCVVGKNLFTAREYEDVELDKAIQLVYKLLIAKLVGSDGVKNWESSVTITKKDGTTITLDADALEEADDPVQVGGSFRVTSNVEIN
jgi:hypothetical protein